LKAIIIELNGSGARYGYIDKEINEQLTAFGFFPYAYDPRERKIQRLDSWGTTNTIYIRDIDFVQRRLVAAPPFEIFGKSI
jgi:hypothetical protein